MPRRPRVFIPNKSPHDFSMAESFGELVFCTEGLMDRYSTGTMFRALWPHLSQSNPDDLILVTGLVHLNMIAAAIMSYLHGRVNLLLFNGEGYVKRTVVLDSFSPNASA